MKKVLIIDDIAANIQREKGILGRADFRVFTASTGAEALQVHRDEKVDLIIIGLEFSDMPADKLCSALRDDESLRHVSIIVVGPETDSAAARAARCKANAYITLPLQPAAFLDRVGRFLQIPLRKDYRVLFRVSVSGTSRNETFFCNSQNISVSGVLLETPKRLIRGDRITCSFFLPESGQVVADAEVVRVAQKEDLFHYGVRFIDLKTVHRTAIEKFIRKRANRV